ncbi:MAG: hypothetical protein HS111_08950 [Kofleriaceae bacterium]|nr:hypothetical protein [Kofleriaceae bacterium]
MRSLLVMTFLVATAACGGNGDGGDGDGGGGDADGLDAPQDARMTTDAGTMKPGSIR